MGGRAFTDTETVQLIALCEQYGLDTDDEADTATLMERLWLAYGSYLATEAAYALQVGVADELRDLDTLMGRARRVLHLVEQAAELTDDEGCLQAATKLTQCLHSFPNLIETQTTFMPERQQFMHARRELLLSLPRVRLWAAHRAHFIANLELVIDVCQRVERPKVFTKRSKTARHMFQRELAVIYCDLLHPLRYSNWKETNREPNNPPPPESTRAFAHAVMTALGVPFEVKGVSG